MKSIKLESYGGFLFVNLGLNAVPLSKISPKFLQDMYDVCPQPDNLVRVRCTEREIAANWKTLIDYNNVEDVSLCENLQKGLHSKGYEQGQFVVNRDHVEYSEHHVHFFQNLVRGALVGEH